MAATKKPAKSAPCHAASEPRQPKGREREAMDKARTRYFDRADRFRSELRDRQIGPAHSDDLGWCFQKLNAFGTTSPDFAAVEINRLVSATSPDGSVDLPRLNAALAVVDGLQPENEVEAMLAVQMAATHAVTMEMMARTTRADTAPQKEAFGNLAVKLSRTFAAQVEALAKLRRKGEQKVTVEHVHVYAGGQAVVGNVTHNGVGGGRTENDRQPDADDARSLAFAPDSPVWSEDQEREPLPVPGGQR
ncbi:hypothetical protein [Ancylobacter sp. TS-1]|uniref:hypothetical protein n=1 Tax=Ancylobacter sp. TS-1 TaxID=1850374 RepID=UPI001265CB65|nr:hypothetical protein [Ancylobacter sp. TS-1]QFR34697.1 hypothetical protein GBB76_17195 [Ancylobacter sp. TS-1]